VNFEKVVCGERYLDRDALANGSTAAWARGTIFSTSTVRVEGLGPNPGLLAKVLTRSNFPQKAMGQKRNCP